MNIRAIGRPQSVRVWGVSPAMSARRRGHMLLGGRAMRWWSA
jgi:hypothetical protein